jgi:hypothetical protein
LWYQRVFDKSYLNQGHHMMIYDYIVSFLFPSIYHLISLIKGFPLLVVGATLDGEPDMGPVKPLNPLWDIFFLGFPRATCADEPAGCTSCLTWPCWKGQLFLEITITNCGRFFLKL